LGLAWGYFTRYGNRSLTGPVLGHCLINVLIGPWLMLGFVGFARRRFGRHQLAKRFPGPGPALPTRETRPAARQPGR